MKIATPITMLGLMLGIGLNSPALCVAQEGASAKEAAQTAPTVTRDNFVSLLWERWGGRAGLISRVEMKGKTFSRLSLRPRDNITRFGTSETRWLSNKQLQQLVEKMSAANLPALVGNYEQQRVNDGPANILVLTLSDVNGEDQEFVIRHFNGATPKDYRDFIVYFEAFVEKKFASCQSVTVDVTALFNPARVALPKSKVNSKP